MNRPFCRFWLVLLLLGPGCTLALEIGEIQVQSALNQLFDARIPLPTLTPEELAKVSVKLAPPPMFNEFGLERSQTLAHLVFSIEYNTEGQVYVRIVSTKPIREPSLALLLEFGWPRGKTFREFTVLLDPVQRLAKRPSDRSKTIPVTPPAAAQSPALSTLAVAAAPTEIGNSATSTMSVTLPAGAAAPEAAQPPESSPPSAEISSAEEAPPARIYRPGDTYGPVAAGEGLWGIVLKVRPDPGITRDEMMQALFQANPQAFGKSGVSGLKTGAVLRIPTLREIADFTGSPAARQLAVAEQPTPLAVTAGNAKPDIAAPAPSEPTPAEKTVIGPPEVFPLPQPESLEPVAVTPTPTPITDIAQHQPKPQPESVAAAPEPLQPQHQSEPEPEHQLEPVAAAPEPAQLQSESKYQLEPVVTVPEPVTPEVKPTAESEPIAKSSEPALALPMLEPASATPLLSLAVEDALTPLTAMPLTAMPMQSTAPADEPVAPEPNPIVTAEPPPVVEAVVVTPPAADHSPDPVTIDAPKPSPTPIDAVALLADIEQRIPPSVLKPLSFIQVSNLPSTPMEPLPESSPPAAPMTAAPEIMPTQPPAESSPPTAPIATTPEITVPTQPPVASDVPTNHEYGPVATNERLWDIATRTRPDPSISKDQMMRSLFKANPQAFSKPGSMDSLKVGVMLRIPTLQEIAAYSDSKAARQLLERRQVVEAPAASEPTESASSPTGEATLSR